MRDIRFIKKGWLHVIAGILFCMTLCIGMVCLAETPGTVTAGSAKIRAAADTNSSVLASVKQNQTVDIIGTTTGTDGNTWYQVWVDANSKGYIRSDLVNASGTVSATVSATTSASTDSAAATTASTPAASEDTSETQVTAVDAKTAYVTTNNVRIRKGASTNHGIVGTAKRGMAVTITGEATGSDSKKWYQISFNYNNQTLVGFIRSDFLSFEAIAGEAAVSEITGGEAATETSAETQETENAENTENTETTEQEYTEPEPQPQANAVSLMNTDTVPYIMPGFNQIILTMNEVDYNAYSNGSFYILYANYNGEEGWYLFDSSLGTYSRYPYTNDATAPKDKSGSVGTLPVILLVIIAFVLAGLCVFLYLRLRDYAGEYDDDDDDEEDTIKPGKQAQQRMAERLAKREEKRRKLGDLEDDDEDEEEKPKQQVKPQQAKPQNVRPQGQRPQGARPQAPSQQRPQGQRPAQNQQGAPKRPAASASNPNQGAPRRPMPDQQHRRPEQPMRKAANQSNQARNFIETGDDGDIEFIDL